MLDYVAVTNAGESGMRQGDHMEIGESRKLNANLKKDKKRPADLEPFSFYLSAWEEDRHTIAQANIELDSEGRITEELVNARRQGNFVSCRAARSTTSTSRPSSSSPSLPRSFRSSSMTMPTVPSWVRTCSASPFLCSWPRLPSSAPAWKE